MSMADELRELEELRTQGTLTDAEFTGAKAKLFATDGDDAYVDPIEAEQASQRKIVKEAREYAMALHLTMLSGFVVPLAGLIVPIVMWQMKKDDLPGIDEHGKNATNWIISQIIYIICCIPLMFVIVGIPLAIIVVILGIVFPIIAGIKAAKGEMWRYPMAIPFFR